MATLLEMIPIVSVFFSFSTAGVFVSVLFHHLNETKIWPLTAWVIVGAALWAADIEARGTTMTETTAPNLRAAAKKAE